MTMMMTMTTATATKITNAVIHPEFQKWGLVGPGSQKMGPTLQNVGSMTVVSYHFVNRTLHTGATGSCKN